MHIWIRMIELILVLYCNSIKGTIGRRNLRP